MEWSSMSLFPKACYVNRPANSPAFWVRLTQLPHLSRSHATGDTIAPVTREVIFFRLSIWILLPIFFSLALRHSQLWFASLYLNWHLYFYYFSSDFSYTIQIIHERKLPHFKFSRLEIAPKCCLTQIAPPLGWQVCMLKTKVPDPITFLVAVFLNVFLSNI